MKQMATVRILLELWRLRRFVACVCVVAVLAGLFVSFTSKTYDIGIATAQVLVDTPQSQVADDSSSISAAGAQTLGTLGVQANLLAGLMVEGTIKTDIAQRAGLKPNQLVGVSSAVTVPSAAGSGSGSASGASSVSVPAGQNVFALTTQILTDSAGMNTLPIIEINTQAPDLAKAVQLANAAVSGLQAFIDSEAANERIPNADRLSIMSLGVSPEATQTRGSSPTIGVLVTVVVLVLGCSLLLWIARVVRSWRNASERERLGLPLEEEAERVTYEPAPAAGPARRLVVGSNRLARPHVGTNGSSDKRDHVGVTVAADDLGVATEDTSGQGGPPSPSRPWSSRQWSPRKL
jgi:hypothetical protein